MPFHWQTLTQRGVAWGAVFFLLLGAVGFPLDQDENTLGTSIQTEHVIALHRGVGFEEVRQAISDLPPGSLLILDCTRTLMEPQDSLLRYGKWSDLTQAALGRSLTVSEARRLKLLCDWQSKKRLTHPDWPGILSQAAARGVRMMALTKHPVGYLDEESPSFEGIRVQQLRELGIDLSVNSPKIDLNRVRAQLPGRELSYAGGILFAPDGMKGPILEALFTSSQTSFSKVLVIDDSATQCESMALSLDKLKVPGEVLCFEDANKQRPVVDPLIAAIQLRTLFEQDLWLGDEAAGQILQQAHAAKAIRSDS